MLVFLSNLIHNIIESVCFNCFYAFLLVDLIHGDAFILKSEEEEHHLINLLCVPLLFLLLFPEFQTEFLFLYEYINHVF